jgi:hypothetical protein
VGATGDLYIADREDRLNQEQQSKCKRTTDFHLINDRLRREDG